MSNRGKIKNTREKRRPLPLLILAACLLFGLSLGVRMNYGIILNAFADHAGLMYSKISLVIAIGELVYGVTQPAFGVLALKKSNGFVLMTGLLLLAVGFALSAFARTPLLLTLTLGMCISAGTGALSFGIIMGGLSPFVGKSKASAVSGIVNASSGIGSSIMSPLVERLIAAAGITKGMLVLSLPALVFLPLALLLSKAGETKSGDGGCEEERKGVPVRERLKAALSSRTYRYLMMGFGTCGFHMSLIQNHLYSQIVSYGIDKSTAAFAYTTFGIGTMLGALACGLICLKVPLKRVLGSIYGLRVLLIAVFLFILPKNVYSVVFFGIALGLTGDATVTPTSEIVSRKFGAESMGLLFGFVFVCHQIGSFISTWLAGYLFQITGEYQVIWMVNLCLCGLASLVSYRIRVSDYETLA
ncbi:MAG: MFS transporter [Eubacteriales bacterium]|nr:MFS transporter [Eubacteriales bacterium]